MQYQFRRRLGSWAACACVFTTMLSAPAVASAADMPAAPAASAPASDAQQLTFVPIDLAPDVSRVILPAEVPASAPDPVAAARPQRVSTSGISAGDSAWMITATALVLLMTIPGLALFYAGMVRKKNILATMAQSFIVCGLVSLLWFVCGYSLAFMPGNGFAGDLSAVWLDSVYFHRLDTRLSVHPLAPSIPEALFVMFQMGFAIITPALITGAFAERMRFSALLWFMGTWSLLVYAPVAHWVWEPTGWLAQRGVLDFAGGTVVHVNAGVAGLVAAFMLGRRLGFGRESMRPANLGYTLIGASLLWVGWLGFNGGSAGAADGRAAMAILATQLAGATAALSWLAAEWLVRGTPTLLGMCSGALAGLVAVTPASGFVDPKAAVLIGAIAGVACYWGATGLKRMLGADDSLDVFGVHGVAGILGALLTGLLAVPAIGGVSGSLLAQALGVLATLAYSGTATALILWGLDKLVGLRVPPVDEAEGLDLSLHGERVE